VFGAVIIIIAYFFFPQLLLHKVNRASKGNGTAPASNFPGALNVSLRWKTIKVFICELVSGTGLKNRRAKA